METFIQQSESKASELQKAQDQQAEALSAQSRAQEAIQFDAQVSQALLAKTSVAAANLQSVIDDAAFKFKQVPGFGIGGSPALSLCAVLLIVIAAQNLQIAIALFFLILGTCVLHDQDRLIGADTMWLRAFCCPDHLQISLVIHTLRSDLRTRYY